MTEHTPNVCFESSGDVRRYVAEPVREIISRSMWCENPITSKTLKMQ